MNWLHEDDLSGLADGFFDDFINHIDFPLDDTNNVEADWNAKFRDLEPPPMDLFSILPSDFTFQKTIPILKQPSSSQALTSLPPDIKVSKQFKSSSPVSVLESSDTSFSPHNSILTFPVKGMRSKRKRPTPQRLRYLFSFESKKAEKLMPVESESHSYFSSEQHTKKKRKIQLNTHTVSSTLKPSNSDVIERKCTHCETTKTPQWREGPNGPKTLCNACGVRFRSGRLVPEYRPASSPTFIPSVHSNSHRKIIEMRRKDDNQF